MKFFALLVSMVCLASYAYGADHTTAPYGHHYQINSDQNVRVESSHDYRPDFQARGWERIQQDTWGPAPGPQILINPYCPQRSTIVNGQPVPVATPLTQVYMVYLEQLDNGRWSPSFDLFADKENADKAEVYPHLKYRNRTTLTLPILDRQGNVDDSFVEAASPQVEAKADKVGWVWVVYYYGIGVNNTIATSPTVVGAYALETWADSAILANQALGRQVSKVQVPLNKR